MCPLSVNLLMTPHKPSYRPLNSVYMACNGCIVLKDVSDQIYDTGCLWVLDDRKGFGS